MTSDKNVTKEMKKVSVTKKKLNIIANQVNRLIIVHTMSCQKMLITKFWLCLQILALAFAASEIGSKYEEIGFGVKSNILVPGVFFLALPRPTSTSGVPAPPVPMTITIRTQRATNKTNNRQKQGFWTAQSLNHSEVNFIGPKNGYHQILGT